MRRAVRLVGRTVRASLRLESINFSGRIRLRGCGCNQGCAHVDDSPIRVPPCRPILAPAARRFRSWSKRIGDADVAAGRRRNMVWNERASEGNPRDPPALRSSSIGRSPSVDIPNSGGRLLASAAAFIATVGASRDDIELLSKIGRRDAGGARPAWFSLCLFEPACGPPCAGSSSPPSGCPPWPASTRRRQRRSSPVRPTRNPPNAWPSARAVMRAPIAARSRVSTTLAWQNSSLRANPTVALRAAAARRRSSTL